MDPREMRQKRAALIAQARELLDKAEKENRDLTAEETQQYDRIMAEVDSLKARIEREERLQGLEDEVRRSHGRLAGGKDQPGAGTGRAVSVRASEEYREAFWLDVRYGKQALSPEQYKMLIDVRAMTIGTDPAGGYLVPEEFEAEIVKGLSEENVMRTLARVVTASSDRNIPVETGRAQAYWTGEEKSYTESQVTLGRRTLGAHKLTALIKVSEELLQDSMFDLEAFLREEFVYAMGAKEEAAFINGDGVGKPLGVVVDAEVGVTAASATAVTADELIDLYHSLRRPYRRRATFMANDNTLKAIRKLKDNTGQYLWQPGLQAGQPDTLLGRPVVAASDMPEMAAGNKSILFGDFSFYRIVDRAGRAMQRLAELYATEGMVGFRAFQRVDGALLVTEAVKALRQAA